MPKDILGLVQRSTRDLRKSLNQRDGSRLQVVLCRTTSFVASSHRTADGTLLILVSLGLIVRVALFSRLLLQFDGHRTSRLIGFGAPLGASDRPALPGAFKLLLEEWIDREAEFWQAIKLEISAVQLDEGVSDSIWQQIALLIQFLIVHEFSHLANHHHCFQARQCDVTEQKRFRQRLMLEILADRDGARALANGVCQMPASLFNPLIAFATYSTCAYFHLSDFHRDFSRGWLPNNSDYVHPHLRSCHFSDYAAERIAESDPSKKTQWIRHSNLAWYEFVQNLNSLALDQVAKHPLYTFPLLATPGLNVIDSAQSLDKLRALAEHRTLYAELEEVSRNLDQFCQAHRADCWPIHSIYS